MKARLQKPTPRIRLKNLQDFSADMKKEACSLGLLKSCLEDERQSEAEPFTRTSNNRSVSTD